MQVKRLFRAVSRYESEFEQVLEYYRKQHLPCGARVILGDYQLGIIEDPWPDYYPGG